MLNLAIIFAPVGLIVILSSAIPNQELTKLIVYPRLPWFSKIDCDIVFFKSIDLTFFFCMRMSMVCWNRFHINNNVPCVHSFCNSRGNRKNLSQGILTLTCGKLYSTNVLFIFWTDSKQLGLNILTLEWVFGVLCWKF